jgi:hypothetical protein
MMWYCLKRQCQPQCICLHFTLKVMECQQITIINISLVLCRYNSVKMSKYNHRMVEIYDGLKTKTWITLPMLLFEHCLSAQCIVVDIVPLRSKSIYHIFTWNDHREAGHIFKHFSCLLVNVKKWVWNLNFLRFPTMVTMHAYKLSIWTR